MYTGIDFVASLVVVAIRLSSMTLAVILVSFLVGLGFIAAAVFAMLIGDAWRALNAKSDERDASRH